jgi:hypothetical protein
MTPTDDGVQDLRERFIEHSTEVNAWFGEQWRRNERTDDQLTSIGGDVRTLLSWKDNVMGRFAIIGFLGSLAGGALMTVILKIFSAGLK